MCAFCLGLACSFGIDMLDWDGRHIAVSHIQNTARHFTYSKIHIFCSSMSSLENSFRFLFYFFEKRARSSGNNNRNKIVLKRRLHTVFGESRKQQQQLTATQCHTPFFFSRFSLYNTKLFRRLFFGAKTSRKTCNSIEIYGLFVGHERADDEFWFRCLDGKLWGHDGATKTEGKWSISFWSFSVRLWWQYFG